MQRQIGARWPIRADINPHPRADGASAGPFELWMARHFYFLLPEPFSIVVQVALEDGMVAVFDVNVPQEPLSRFEAIVPLILLLMLVCFSLSGFLVRMTTGSLDRLSRAADAIGRNPQDAPLADSGPSEIHRVISAFNRMQARVRDYLVERGRREQRAQWHDEPAGARRERDEDPQGDRERQGKAGHDLHPGPSGPGVVASVQ